MSKIFIGIIFALGLFTFFLWNENSKLAELNQAFELRDKEQKLALKTVQNDFALQTSSLKDLQSKNNAIELEMSRYLDIFKRHNLTKLANAKPSLIETRVNARTQTLYQ